MNDSRLILDDLTFLIPVRIDSLERLENLIAVTTFLCQQTRTNIIVLESDVHNHGMLEQCLHPSIYLKFVADLDPVFHRTKYINLLTTIADTPFLAIWDADVIVPIQQLLAAIVSLRVNTFEFVYPYDGRFLDTGVASRRLFLDELSTVPLNERQAMMTAPYSSQACGGGFLVAKDAYAEVGQENEFFYGWGLEDGERLKRWRILERRIGWVSGPIYHLYHPRTFNSFFHSEAQKAASLTEVDRIGNMNKQELMIEVKMWMAYRKRVF